MNHSDTEKHYKQQITHFGKEFSKISEYKPHASRMTYVKRIKKYLLDLDKDSLRNKTLIDIGTGEGFVAVEVAKLGLNVIACDLTRQALKNLARFKKQFGLSNIKLVESQADDLPLKNHSVDCVVANAILEHIPNEEKAIKEWKRILKQGGRMMVTVPLKYKYILPFFWPMNFIHDKQVGHLRRYDLESLRRKFNLRVVNYFYTGHLVKVLGFIASLVFRTDILNQALEDIDQRQAAKRYGSTNIIVVFEKG